MAVDVDRHCYHGVFTYNIFLFLAFSLPCGKFSGLICLICGVSRLQYEQVNVEEIGDGPFTLAWRSMQKNDAIFKATD